MLEVAVRHRLGGFRLDVAFASGGRLDRAVRPLRLGQDHAGQRHRRPASARRRAASWSTGAGALRHRGRRLRAAPTAAASATSSRRGGCSRISRCGRTCSSAAGSRRARERRAERATVVELLGIGHLLDRRPAGLSGGEKQRVAIGRALLASPRLLLMDEPSASLDAARKEEILPYLERLRDEGECRSSTSATPFPRSRASPPPSSRWSTAGWR